MTALAAALDAALDADMDCGTSWADVDADEVAATWDALDLSEWADDECGDDISLISLSHVYGEDVADLDLVSLDY